MSDKKLAMPFLLGMAHEQGSFHRVSMSIKKSAKEHLSL